MNVNIINKDQITFVQNIISRVDAVFMSFCPLYQYAMSCGISVSFFVCFDPDKRMNLYVRGQYKQFIPCMINVMSLI